MRNWAGSLVFALSLGGITSFVPFDQVRAACAANPCFVAPAAVGVADGSAAANATTLTDAMGTVALSGGIVLAQGAYTLPAGNFATRGTIKIGSNTTLTGAGKDITLIQRATGATLSNGITLVDVDPNTGLDTANPVDFVRIQGITLGSPASPIPTLAGLTATGFSNAGIASVPNVAVSRVFMFDVGSSGHGSAGFSFASLSALSLTTNRFTNFIFDNVTANWNRRGGVGRGIWFTGQQRNIMVENSTFLGNGIAGVDFNDGASRGVRLRNNQVIGNIDSGIALQALDVVNPLVDPIASVPALIDPRSGADVTPSGILIADNVVRDNGRFGIEAKGANGTSANPYAITGNTLSTTPGFLYGFSLLGLNSALGNTTDATFGDCRDRAGIIVARLQGVRANGAMLPEPASGSSPNGTSAPSGVTVAGNSVRNINHPFNNIDAATVDLIPGGALNARAACVPALSPDRDGFGIVLEGSGNVVQNNIVLGNDVGIQAQADNLNNSLGVAQTTTPTPYFDRGTGTPLGGNTVTQNIVCGNVDFDLSKVIALPPSADPAPYPFPANYFGLNGPVLAKLQLADATGYLTDPYSNAFIAANAALCGPIPDLSLAKTHPVSFAVGVQANATLTVTNNGTGSSPASVNIKDKLPAYFQFNSAVAGAGATGVSCAASGTLSVGLDLDCTVAIALGLAPSASANIIIAVTPLAAAAQIPAINKARVNRLGNAALDPSLCTATGTLAGCAVTTALTPASRADMAVPPTLLALALVVGTPIPNTTLICTNTGPNSATDATCAVSGLPPGLGVSCTPAPQPIATLVVNSTIQCVVSGTPTTPVSGTITLSTNAANDANAANNSSTMAFSVAALADVYTLIVVQPSVVLGDSLSAQFTFGNNGPNPAQTVMPSASLPPGLAGVIVSNGGVYNATTGAVEWPTLATLAPVTAVVYTARWTPPALGSVVVSAQITTTTVESLLPNNTRSAQVTVELPAQPVPILHSNLLAWLMLCIALVAMRVRRNQTR